MTTLRDTFDVEGPVQAELFVVWLAGPVRPHGRYDFEAVDGGTRLTFALDAALGGIRGLLMGSMVHKTMDAEVAAIDRARAVLEA